MMNMTRGTRFPAGGTIRAIFCVACAAALHAQQVSPLPNWVLYMAVFNRVNAQERFAEHLDKMGKTTGNEVRQQIRNRAKLTEHEDTVLRTAAKTFDRELAAFLKKRGRLLEARRNAATPADKESLTAQINAAEEQNVGLVLQLVAELVQGFGPARFQAFDSYVRLNIAPSVVFSPLKKVR